MCRRSGMSERCAGRNLRHIHVPTPTRIRLRSGMAARPVSFECIRTTARAALTCATVNGPVPISFLRGPPDDTYCDRLSSNSTLARGSAKS